ncbi:MAG: hypothetical protein ACHQAY_27285 [Hyphomicrobiales bacterium]
MRQLGALERKIKGRQAFVRKVLDQSGAVRCWSVCNILEDEAIRQGALRIGAVCDATASRRPQPF